MKFGAIPSCSTSSRLKKASIAARALHLNSRGVYIQKDPDGRKRAYGYVLTKERTAELGIEG